MPRKILKPIVDNKKQCSKCTAWLPLSLFRRRKLKTVLSYRSQCKECEEPFESRNKSWTAAEIFEIAKKYDCFKDFRKNERAALGAAERRGIKNEVCAHMKFGTSFFKKGQSAHNKKWDKDSIAAEALKYKHKSDFVKFSSGAVDAAYNLKIYNEVCSHMDRKEGIGKIYTKEKCLEAAKNFEYRAAFYDAHKELYRAADRNGWLSEICSHMKYMGQFSVEQCKIYNMISKQIPSAILGFRMKGKGFSLEWDIFIPEIKVAIEYDGTHWHNNQNAKMRDERKNVFAKENGIKLIRIPQNQWENNKYFFIEKINKDLNISLDDKDLICMVDIRFFNQALIKKARLYKNSEELKKNLSLYKKIEKRNLFSMIWGEKCQS